MLCRQGISSSIGTLPQAGLMPSRPWSHRMSLSSSIHQPVRRNFAFPAGWRVLPGWTDAMAGWLGRRQAREDLIAMDDRLLEDIGILREDAVWKAGKAF